MADQWRTERTEPVAVGARDGQSRTDRIREQRKRLHRKTTAIVTVVVLIVVVVAAVYLGSKLWHNWFGDYSGAGKNDVVIQVHHGDTTRAIGQTLRDSQVVASVEKFIDAAKGNPDMSSVQPGYYLMRTEISAADAVNRLTDPDYRVGVLVIPEGRQLDDVRDVKTDKPTDGILTLISKASCVLGQCVSVDALRQAAANEPVTSLKVPQWAIKPIEAMGADHRRLEGLIAPGAWNINPSSSPQEILATLINDSATQYSQHGLTNPPDGLAMSPYQTLIVASLVQRESKPADFAKVARVIYNRLQEHQRLEFDSTVNYPLDRQEVATTDADRARQTPWNTYVMEGLPATPICSPGAPAVSAAEHPEPGDWLYFVTVDMQGTTKFTRDYAEHLANIDQARRNGVLDSGR